MPLARMPLASRRSPRRLCARKQSSAVGARRSRRLGSCPIRCAARCGYFLMAHRGADRAAVKPLRESWPRSWAVNLRPLREPCAGNPHPRSPPPQINRGAGLSLFPLLRIRSPSSCLLSFSRTQSTDLAAGAQIRARRRAAARRRAGRCGCVRRRRRTTALQR